MASKMNIQACTPLEARKAFWWGPFINFGWGMVIFIPLCFLLMVFCNPLVAALLAFVPAILTFLYLESRVIVIECPSCQRDINTNTPWECGYKGCRNENVDKYPFIHECEVCHYIPKAYVCHHNDCQRLIYLTSDRQQDYAAKRLEPPKSPPPAALVKDPVKEKTTRQVEEIRAVQHELAIAKLKKEMEIVKNKPATPPPVTSETQAIMDRVRKEVARGKTLLNLEAELLAEARKECGDDEENFSEMKKVILQVMWMEKERMERSSQQGG
jgi:hypothetical protein